MIDKLGPIFRIHRRSKNIKLDEICSLCNISTRKLSEFETGKRALDDETLTRIYRELHIKYRRRENEMESFRSLFYEFYENVIYYHEYTDSYDKLMFMEDYIKTTELYPQLILARLVFHAYMGDHDYEYGSDIKMLDMYFEYLDQNQQQIYYDAVGVHYKNESKYDVALEFFNKAIFYGYEPVTAIMCYHKALLLRRTGKLIDSLDCAREAKLKFDKTLNFNRSILCSGAIALASARLGQFQNAIEIYKKCILHLNTSELQSDLLKAWNNLTWTYVLSGQFEDVIKSANKTLEINSEHVSSYFYRSYAFHKLGEGYKAKENIKTAKALASSGNCTPYMAAMVEAFYTLLSVQKNTSTKVRKLNAALQQAEKCNDYQLELFVLNLIVEAYKEDRNYEDAFYYQSKMVKIYEKRK